MVSIVVCDDNALHLEHAAALIRDAAAEHRPELRTYTDSVPLLKSIREEGFAPDIAVLDIRMESLDGIALADEINRLLPECRVIFLTGYAGYAPEVYTTRHIWFVLKDRVDEFLPLALERALSELDQRREAADLMVRLERKTLRLPLEDVLYIERQGRKYNVVCRETVYTGVKLLTGFAELQKTGEFMRSHQGYWVNDRYVQALDHSELVMANGVRIPISRTNREKVRERFFDARRL